MSYYNAIEYLYGLQKYGIKLGLEKTRAILSVLGDPYSTLRFVHVAGTNGKGSVSSMLSSVLMAHGSRVGLFTSPHLVSFTERIRINNEQISESEVVSLTEEIRSALHNSQSEIPDPTFFEFVTAMAFLYFSRNKVDWVVMEVGMGGRLDATNVITPVVSVITKIGLDHKEFLGNSLTEIATEKAGIIKQGIPVISAMQGKEAAEVIHNTAHEKSAPLFVYGKDFHGDLRSSGLNGVTFNYHNAVQSIPDMQTSLAGEHQVLNACLAIKAFELCVEHYSVTASIPDARRSAPDAVREGLGSTKWPGRLEMVSEGPHIMIDGAHNPDAAVALSEFIKKYLGDYKIILIMGVMSDKDVQGILGPLLPLASEIIFTAPDYGRAAPPQKLAEYAADMGFSSKIAVSVKDAIEMARQSSAEERKPTVGTQACGSAEVKQSFREPSELILITGSFYTIGEAKELLGEKAILGNLRETL